MNFPSFWQSFYGSNRNHSSMSKCCDSLFLYLYYFVEKENDQSNRVSRMIICFKINKARVGCFERTASKHVYYLGWNRSPAQAGCMRQVLGPGALGRPRGIGWRGRWEGGSGWGTHVSPWLIHVNVWQNPLQYCKGISLKKKKKNINNPTLEHSVLQRIASFPGNSQLVCMSTLYYFTILALG